MVTKPFILGLLLLLQLVRLVFCTVHEAASETFLSDASSSRQQGAAAEQTFPSGCWTQPQAQEGSELVNQELCWKLEYHQQQCEVEKAVFYKITASVGVGITCSHSLLWVGFFTLFAPLQMLE